MRRSEHLVWNFCLVIVGLFLLFAVGFFVQQQPVGQFFSQLYRVIRSEDLLLDAQIEDPVSGILSVSSEYTKASLMDDIQEIVWCVFIQGSQEALVELFCQDSLEPLREQFVIPDETQSFTLFSQLSIGEDVYRSELIPVEWIPSVRIAAPQGDDLSLLEEIPYQSVYILRSRLSDVEVSLSKNPISAQQVVEGESFAEFLSISDTSIVLNNWFVPLPPEDQLGEHTSLCITSETNAYERCYPLRTSLQADVLDNPLISEEQTKSAQVLEPDIFLTETSESVLFFSGIEDQYSHYQFHLLDGDANLLQRVLPSGNGYTSLQTVLSPSKEFVLELRDQTRLLESYLFTTLPPYTITPIRSGSAEEEFSYFDAVDIQWKGTQQSEIASDYKHVYDHSGRGFFATDVLLENISSDVVLVAVSLPGSRYSIQQRIESGQSTLVPVRIDPLAYGAHQLLLIIDFQDTQSAPIVYDFLYTEPESFIDSSWKMMSIVGILLVVVIFVVAGKFSSRF